MYVVSSESPAKLAVFGQSGPKLKIEVSAVRVRLSPLERPANERVYDPVMGSSSSRTCSSLGHPTNDHPREAGREGCLASLSFLACSSRHCGSGDCIVGQCRASSEPGVSHEAQRTLATPCNAVVSDSEKTTLTCLLPRLARLCVWQRQQSIHPHLRLVQQTWRKFVTLPGGWWCRHK